MSVIQITIDTIATGFPSARGTPADLGLEIARLLRAAAAMFEAAPDPCGLDQDDLDLGRAVNIEIYG